MSTHLLRVPHYKTKASTDEYRTGWDAVFGVAPVTGDGDDADAMLPAPPEDSPCRPASERPTPPSTASER